MSSKKPPPPPPPASRLARPSGEENTASTMPLGNQAADLLAHSSSGARQPPPPPTRTEDLAHAPAAVQAMAAQVVAAHVVGTGGEASPGGGYNPQPPQLPVPAAPPASSPEDASDVHMIALRVGVVVNGRYEIIRIVGRGGMGSVYEVKHTNTGERLALKLLHPALAENEAAVERFRTEARAPVRIASDHVVRIIDADISGELGDVPFIVMEYLDGVDLRGDLRRRGAIPAGEVALYLGQVARALDKAHQKNIVHRDLKPANLHVQTREDGSPLVKVLDFGIAKLTDDAAQELTMAGQVFGTPWYMAPEQARGDLGAVGPATDRWALGLIAFQLLTGRNYWTADGMAALIGQICYEPMAPPTATAPHLGPLFDIWFARACNRDPQLRFDSSKEMIAELSRALGIQPSAAGITTGAGFNADSSLQIQVSSSDAGQLGSAIPGTVLSARPPLDSTDAPLYTSQLPNPGRAPASNTLAVLLGVVVALVIAAASVAIYLVSDHPQVTQGPVTAKTDPIAPTDSPAPKAEDEKKKAEDEKKKAEDEKKKAEDEKKKAEDEKKKAEDEKKKAATAAQPPAGKKPRATTSPARVRRPPKTTPPPPPKGPAPSVGSDIQF